MFKKFLKIFKRKEEAKAGKPAKTNLKGRLENQAQSVMKVTEKAFSRCETQRENGLLHGKHDFCEVFLRMSFENTKDILQFCEERKKFATEKMGQTTSAYDNGWCIGVIRMCDEFDILIKNLK